MTKIFYSEEEALAFKAKHPSAEITPIEGHGVMLNGEWTYPTPESRPKWGVTLDMIDLDPSDLSGMCELMDAYGDSLLPYMGENEAGERVQISIFKDHITTATYQDNDWIRVNTYWRDGTREETYRR